MGASYINKVGWNEFNHFVESLAKQIPRGKYRFIHGVPRGGMIPAVMLSHMLDIPVLPVLNSSTQIITKEGLDDLLIVDDIADSGRTIEKYKNRFDIATVYVKINLEERPTYWATVAAVDEWVLFPYERKVIDSCSSVTFDTYHSLNKEE